MKKRVFGFSFFLLVVSSVFAGEMDPFVGTWQVDYKATLEGAVKSPKYDPEKDAKILPVILKKIAETFFLEITDDDVIFTQGERSTAMPYTVKSADKDSVVVSCSVAEKTFTMAFEHRGKKRMGFKSSLTDDMDFYVWEPRRGNGAKK
ncbi:MAG: hypothetical protein RRC34_13245 [Lentisphaeria bacterium]|nr:hypothetical protein [Lentisphaeria bacterium]